MTRALRRIGEQGSFYGLLMLLVVFAAFPFYWLLITTFKSEGDLYNLEAVPYWFKTAPTSNPLTKDRWSRKNTRSGTAMATKAAEVSRCHDWPRLPATSTSLAVTGRFSDPPKIRPIR